MINCRQVTRLISQSMDAELPWHRRLAMRIHLLYCVWCRRYAAQLRFLRKATRELGAQGPDHPAEKLPGQAKARMRARLQAALKDSPTPPH